MKMMKLMKYSGKRHVNPQVFYGRLIKISRMFKPNGLYLFTILPDSFFTSVIIESSS
jgi:hypothetical protein